MQPVLLPDYFRGYAKLPSKYRGQWEALTRMINIIKSCSTVIEHNLDIRGMPDPELFELINKDHTFQSFVINYMLYEKHGGKNYVIGKDLSKALSATSKDVSLQYIPEMFYGFIHIPPIFDKTYHGAFVSIGVDKGKRFLSVSILISENDMLMPGRISFPLDGVTWKDVMATLDLDEGIKIRHLDESDRKYVNVVLQSIIYISNTDQELIEEVNSFSTKQSKRDYEKKVYTSLPFIRVGFNFHLPRSFSVDSTVVTGHFRWQPWGPGRSLVKHIYIDPYVRNYNVDH